MKILTMLLSVLILLPIKIFAKDYGYLRVTVVEINSSHKSHVNLILNGSSVMKFSHATVGFQTVGMEPRFLANGNSTPLKSDYGSLASDCKFDYRVDFSFDRQNWISLGIFNAPTQSVNKKLPIGLCGGTVCSSDPLIQSQINKNEDAQWKKNAELIKRKFEDALSKEKRELEKIEQELIYNEIDRNSFEDFNKNIDNLSNRLEDYGNVDLGESQRNAVSIDTVIARAIEAGTVHNLLNQAVRDQNFYNNCLQSSRAAQYLCSQYGGMGWIGAAAEMVAVALSSNSNEAVKNLESRILDPSVQTKLQSQVAKKAEMQLRIQSVLDIKRAQKNWDALVGATRLGVAFTPLNDAVDFCEAFTGRELCLDSGMVLSNEQRFLAAVGVIAGSRLIWNSLSDRVKLEIFSDLTNGIAKADHHLLLKDLNNVVVKDASEVNALLRNRYPEPPYKLNTKVFEFTTHTEIKGQFVRVFLDEQNMVRPWIIDKNSIKGLTPHLIKDKLALPYVPRYIADVDIPAGVTIRKGVLNQEIFNSKGKNIVLQYEVAIEKLPEGMSLNSLLNIKNKRDL